MDLKDLKLDVGWGSVHDSKVTRIGRSTFSRAAFYTRMRVSAQTACFIHGC